MARVNLLNLKNWNWQNIFPGNNARYELLEMSDPILNKITLLLSYLAVTVLRINSYPAEPGYTLLWQAM